jgi:uncharacterized protein (DUF433 family)
MLVETRYEHVVLNDAKVPVLAGTTMKVSELVQAKMAYGWSAEELQFQFPYLTMGQIYSALAYYADHRTEMEDDFERRKNRVGELNIRIASRNFQQRLSELQSFHQV